ncbi:hypothetical protein [Actinomadura flavalba]|uniref:hypothetical protein n=1 Tax=Actinomadura flavalba TaxID=1120938 RepID=UPI00037EBAC6|nr:hypothetical protein [Actinomadura flavalba]
MASESRVGYLEELEEVLDGRGLVARVVRTRSGPAFLRVVNPAAASLAEDVTCAPLHGSHEHYFWWSWGERMHRVDDPGGAASKLAHVLQPLREECRDARGRAVPSRAGHDADPVRAGRRARP